GRSTSARDRRTPRRALLLLAVGFIVLSLRQAPGKLIADTKLDVVLDPLGFMARATHLWNSSSDFGFLPNQYIGYLFPMGPFFLAGDWLRVPPWITQRLWLALLLTVAAWGVVRLTDAMRIGMPWTRVFGGLAYSLSPMFLGKIGSASIAMTGATILPWITLPLILALRPDGAGGADTGTAAGDGPRERAEPRLSPRRAAALSGLAVFCTGGVNASVTLCVLLCPAVLLVFAGGTRRAWALRGWWVVSVILATAWWMLGLFLQSRYGLNFLPFTETADVTTATTSVAEALRGTTDWLAFLRIPDPWLPAAAASVNDPIPVIGAALVAGLGLFGLASRDLPGRRFLLVSLSVGVVVVSAAYPGEPGSPLADSIRELLAGPLGFLRNVYKFQPVAHLPLALGVTHALTVAAARWPARQPADAAGPAQASADDDAPADRARGRRGGRVVPGVATVFTAVSLVACMAPALTGRLPANGSFDEVPAYWQKAADYLAGNPDGGRTLLVPGVPFAEYEWGRPLDEPLAWLASTPWASRALVPLGGTGMTRWLDGVEHQLELGSAPGLAQALARAGVGQVLVRNDIGNREWDHPPSTEQIHRALESGGLHLTAEFGPQVPIRASGRAQLVPELAHPKGTVASLEVWVVPDGARTVVAYPTDTMAVVSGGAEATLQLAAAGVLGADRAAVLASDLSGLPGRPEETSGTIARAVLPDGGESTVSRPDATELVGPTSAWLVTDTFQRRDQDFGAVHGAKSYLLGPDEKVAGKQHPPAQWSDGQPVAYQTVAGYADGVQVAASSYGSSLVPSPDQGPFAAVDGLTYTAWTASPDGDDGSRGAWIQVSAPRQIEVPYIEVQLLQEGDFRPKVGAIRVTTEAGSAVTEVQAVETPQQLTVPPGPSSWFRLTFERITKAGDPGYGAGFREITIPGLLIQRYAQVPADAAGLFARQGQGQVVYSFERTRVDITEPFGGSEEQTISRRFEVPRPMRLKVGGGIQAIPSAVAAEPGSPAPFVVPCGGGLALLVDGMRYDLRVEGTMGDVAAARPLRMTVCTPDETIPLGAGPHVLSIDHGGTALLVSSLTLAETRAQATESVPRATSVTAWSPERREVRIEAGEQAFLAIRENFNSSWTATVNGLELQPVRLDGWQQGWIVPAGAAATILIENKPGQVYQRNLVIGGLLFALLPLLALAPARWRLRRSVDPDGYPRLLDPSRLPLLPTLAGMPTVLAGGLLATLAVFLVAGPLALAVPVLVFLGLRWPVLLPWAALVAMTAAGVGVLGGPDAVPGSGRGPFSSQVQLAGTLAFAAAVANLALPARGARPGRGDPPDEDSPDEEALDEDIALDATGPRRAPLARSTPAPAQRARTGESWPADEADEDDEPVGPARAGSRARAPDPEDTMLIRLRGPLSRERRPWS
ncbi:MAG: DUF3367 domain-containing protein, partial [Frankia sp.]|nr:DUF3367 domain-containing protein [Frankia sp.]